MAKMLLDYDNADEAPALGTLPVHVVGGTVTTERAQLADRWAPRTINITANQIVQVAAQNHSRMTISVFTDTANTAAVLLSAQPNGAPNIALVAGSSRFVMTHTAGIWATSTATAVVYVSEESRNV